MTRRQLQEDVYNAESEYDIDPDDPDGNLEAVEHYRLYGGARSGGKAFKLPDVQARAREFVESVYG